MPGLDGTFARGLAWQGWACRESGWPHLVVLLQAPSLSTVLLSQNGRVAGSMDELMGVLDYLQQEVRPWPQGSPEGGGACLRSYGLHQGGEMDSCEGDWDPWERGNFRGPHLLILSNENMGQESALHSCKGNF